jgi:hypothetical protein
MLSLISNIFKVVAQDKSILSLISLIFYKSIREVQFPRKISQLTLSVYILTLVLLTSSLFASTTFIHNNTAYAQSSNTGFGETTYLALPNGKSVSMPYLINTGKVLGVVLDKSRATLDVILSSTSADDNGNLTIQIPRDVVDKDATFRETDNNKTARTLSIQFGKDAKVIDIIGSKSTVQ